MDKYDFYTRSVQDPEGHAAFLFDLYRQHFRRNPKSLREDFCGTFALARAWANQGKEFLAAAIDRDPVPLKKGVPHPRVKVLRKDVRSPGLPKADIACALNFSYGIFKKRPDLVKYLKSVRCQMMVLDVLGGIEMQSQNEIRQDYPDFTYFFEQMKFDPITREALFHIHFETGKKKIRKAFTYDWRMWTVPELREVLEDAGFKKTFVYWEGDLQDGAHWVAYVVALRP